MLSQRGRVVKQRNYVICPSIGPGRKDKNGESACGTDGIRTEGGQHGKSSIVAGFGRVGDMKSKKKKVGTVIRIRVKIELSNTHSIRTG